MKKISKIFKNLWRFNKLWLITTIVVMTIILSASIVAVSNDFLEGTLDTVLGGERRKHISEIRNNILDLIKLIHLNNLIQICNYQQDFNHLVEIKEHL